MIEYRKATLDDIELLINVRIDFLRDAGNITTNEEEKLMRKSNEEFLKEVLINGSYVQWLALESNKIVATSSVSFYKLPPHRLMPSGKTAYIANIYTYLEYRKQGIAYKLLSLSVEEAKNYGCDRVTLHATDMGKTIYEKFGFKSKNDEMVYPIL